jgi:hypothetical protein
VCGIGQSLSELLYCCGKSCCAGNGSFAYLEATGSSSHISRSTILDCSTLDQTGTMIGAIYAKANNLYKWHLNFTDWGQPANVPCGALYLTDGPSAESMEAMTFARCQGCCAFHNDRGNAGTISLSNFLNNSVTIADLVTLSFGFTLKKCVFQGPGPFFAFSAQPTKEF